MEVTSKLYAPSVLSPYTPPLPRFFGGCVGLSAGLNKVVKKEMLELALNQIPVLKAIQSLLIEVTSLVWYLYSHLTL